MRLFSDFKYLLFPTRCFGCRELGYSICSQCRKLWNPHLYKSKILDLAVYSAIPYSPVAKNILLSAKEQNIKSAYRLVQIALSASLHELFQKRTRCALVPIPSRRSSNRRRGRDFINEMAISVAKDFGVAVLPLLEHQRIIRDQRLSGYYANLTTKIQSQISFFRTSGFYQYSIEGMLNYYQLSIEMILRLTKASGQIGIICPSSLFADLTSAKLRKHLLTSNELYFIKYYPEAARLFENVSQSTVIFYLRKGNQTDRIKIEKLDKIFQIKLATIMDIFPNNFEIPLIDKIGWRILGKISKQKKIREISYIRNRRGELDLTFFKPFITTENTGWRLVRGNMISNKCLMDRNGEFVQIDNFLNKKSSDFKLHDYNKVRLVCQQISNIDVRKRLRFVFCKKTDILANSCNYMVSTRNQSDLSILSHILNSSLLNWRFKITSSNNHINNYELDELPMVDLDRFDVNEFANDEKQSDELVCQMYGLNKSETKYIWNANKYVDKSLV